MPTYTKLYLTFLSAVTAIFISSVSIADCGAAPAKPALLDGKTASMEALVATSKAVNAFIANADTYLDCKEAVTLTEAFQAEDKKVKKAAKKEIKALLKQRNNIGAAFNKQVAAYKKANKT